MIRKWLNKNLSLGDNYIVVEAIVRPEDEIVLNAALFAKKEKGVVLKEHLESCTANLIQKKWGKDYPVILCVTGKGVLIKHAGSSEVEPDVSHLFPNANSQDFLFQWSDLGNEKYLSIVRAATFEGIYEPFVETGLRVVYSFIGPQCLYYANKELKENDKLLQSANYSVEGSDEVPVFKLNAELTQTSLTYNNQKLSSIWSLPLGAMLTYSNNLFRERFTLPGYDPILAAAKDQGYKLKFEKSVQIGLMILLGLIIANKLVSYEYTKQFAGLEVRQVMNNGRSQKTIELKKELDLKKELASVAGLNQKDRVSYYSDQIGALIPSDMVLTELTLFPEAVQENSQSKFDSSSILIAGETLNSTAISQLVDDLNRLSWVKEAKIEKISESEEKLVFTVEVNLK